VSLALLFVERSPVMLVRFSAEKTGGTLTLTRIEPAQNGPREELK
jgi:hypothetical protein